VMDGVEECQLGVIGLSLLVEQDAEVGVGG
jgi:hypothetical protein